MAIQKAKRFGADGDKIASLALDYIAKGADPTYLLRSIAQTLDQLYESRAALDIIRGTMAVAPSDRGWYEDTHVLVLISLARFDEAKAAVEKLAKIDETQAAWLRTYVNALTQPFEQWNKNMLAKPDDDGSTTTRSLDEVQGAVRSIAARIETCRAALVDCVGDAAWLPDLAPLDPKRADGDDFDIDDVRGSVPNLLIAMRREWARLCYVLAMAGESAIRLPTEIKPAPRPYDFVDTMLSVRFNLLVDRKNDEPFQPQDKLDEQMGASKWGETTLSALAPHMANVWLEEHARSLAAVRWMAGSIDSVFEDQ